MKKHVKRSIIALLLVGAVISVGELKPTNPLKGEYPPGRGCVSTHIMQQILK